MMTTPMPTRVDRHDLHAGLARVLSVQGYSGNFPADDAIAANVTYTVRILTRDGQGAPISGVRPMWRQRGFNYVRIWPAAVDSLWPAWVISRSVYVWIGEEEAIGTCDGSPLDPITPGGGTPQVPDTPPDDTDIVLPPMSPGGFPIRPIGGSGSSMRVLRAVAGMSDSERAAMRALLGVTT